MEVVALLLPLCVAPFCVAPVCDPDDCADAVMVAIWVAAARTRRAIAVPIAFRDALLWNGIISFMLNRRMNPPVSSWAMPVVKEMLLAP